MSGWRKMYYQKGRKEFVRDKEAVCVLDTLGHRHGLFEASVETPALLLTGHNCS